MDRLRWLEALTGRRGVPEHRTTLPPDVLEQLALMEGEFLRAWWATPLGYLLVTNLRCVPVWKSPHLLDLLEGGDWHTGPEFLFLDLLPPTVVAGRFLSLAEESVDGASLRLEVEHPEEVARVIEAARVEGRAEWSRRREALERLRATGARNALTGPTQTPCAYCGHLFDLRATHCPTCGAPRPPA